MDYYAHIKTDSQNVSVTQALKEHLLSSAKIAAESLYGCNLEKSAYLAGLLHDMGKFTCAFQQYLNGSSGQRRGSVIHSFQGCRFLLEQFHDSEDYLTLASAELLAYAVGAHHGLFDCVSPEHTLGLEHRMERDGTDYSEAVSAFLAEFKKQEIHQLFFAAKGELQEKLLFIWDNYGDDETCACFQVGMLARLLLSALIEGDRRDTAQFMMGLQYPVKNPDMRPVWQARLGFLETKLQQFPSDTEISSVRREISERCKAFASEPAGIYRLNVPTGGGKTLASLRYALQHGARYNKKRLIFTSPLLSILEQNAKVIREYIGDDSLILEHHSNVVHTDITGDAMDMRELLTQSWDSPIVITTMVQLLNTLFSGKTTSIRRFHALSESVIVIDEVQTLPPKLLSMFNLAIRFLSEQCGATIILCSATQPSLEAADKPLRPVPEDIIDPKDRKLLKAFARTELIPLPNMRLDALPALIREKMEQTDSMLVVCNTKKEASTLLDETRAPEWESFHLSASMCMQHRRETVSALNAALAVGKKTLCISTQVIEAGVDISFGCVLRLMAGMDSVIQSAGRCNRHGESAHPCPVYVVNCTDENLSMLADIRRGKAATEYLINEYRRKPGAFDGSLASAKAIERYYTRLYSDMEAHLQDYPLPQAGATLFDLLSCNEKYADSQCVNCEGFCLWQAFKTAGDLFSVFDEDTQDVLVPYGDGIRLITELASNKSDKEMYRLLKLSGAYTVSVYSGQLRKLQGCGAIYTICGGAVLVLQPEFYDNVTGIRDFAKNTLFLEV